MKEKQIPVYGMISETGKSWIVYMKLDKDNNESLLSGHGDFPFNEFPDIPVVSFENKLKSVMKVTQDGLECLETTRQGMFVIFNLLPLTQFLKKVEKFGAEVIYSDKRN